MITRFVKLTFKVENCSIFEQIFEESKDKISQFPGCQGVRMYHDINDPRIYFTFSVWDQPASLENYRQSDLFLTTWKKTKPLFEEKAEAWTVE